MFNNRVKKSCWALLMGVFTLGLILGPAPTAAAEELRIGFLAPLTGPAAQTGKDMRDGFLLYLEEQKNSLAGVKVKLIVEDSQAKPPVAVRKANKFIRQDKVHMFIGGLLASTGYALAPVSTRNKVIYLASIPAADDLTQRQKNKYPYVVRTGWTSSQPSHPFGQWACDNGFKRITTIAADYAFGHEVVGGFQKTFEDCGGKIVQKLWPRLWEKDFPQAVQGGRAEDAPPRRRNERGRVCPPFHGG
jgi:branched-chain amino acid transport system substrate-binding protein